MGVRGWFCAFFRANHAAMKPVHLYRHPSESDGCDVTAIDATVSRPAPGRIHLRYDVTDAAHGLTVPQGEGIRRDGLWRETCFEFFLGRASEDSYREFNFSPAGDWAAYSFDRYRQGMRQLLMPSDPVISCTRTEQGWQIDVDLEVNDLPENGACNMTAVIDQAKFRKTHWAALHAPDKPDFHDPHCFAVAFPSVETA